MKEAFDKASQQEKKTREDYERIPKEKESAQKTSKKTVDDSSSDDTDWRKKKTYDSSSSEPPKRRNAKPRFNVVRLEQLKKLQ